MAVVSGNLYKVVFNTIKLNPNNQRGPKDAYRRGPFEALVVAASPHVVATVLAGDLANSAAPGAGEQVEVTQTEQIQYGDGNIYT